MTHSLVGRAALLVLVSLALPASAAKVELHARGAQDVPTASWATAPDGSLVASEHPLAPTVRAGAGAVLEVTLPDAGRMRMIPLGFGARTGTDAASLRELPASVPGLATVSHDDGAGQSRLAMALGSWPGVDEAFELHARRVKHDLLVERGTLELLGRGDLVATWALELPEGIVAVHGQDGGIRLESAATRQAVAHVPPPVVGDADDAHRHARIARFELDGLAGSPRLTLVVPEAWAFDPAREFPLILDPTVSLEPLGDAFTGWVDEFGNLAIGAIDSGTLEEVGFGGDVRGFAEFDISTIPDGAVVTDVRLEIWIANHDNPLDPAVALPVEIKGVTERASSPPALLWSAIGPMGVGTIYLATDVPPTGPDFCPDSFDFFDFNLGPVAAADVQGLLTFDWFTLGFVSGIVTDPFFDHVDYIGYPETVLSFGCPTTDFPGSRITLVVTYSEGGAPVCSAGGPYVSDCPNGPIVLDGSGSFDPDLDPLTWAWTTDCPGTISDADQPIATLNLEAGCDAECLVTLAVSDASATTSCSAPVSAHDDTPPVVESSDLADFCLWPPRHDYYCVGAATAHIIARDACQPGVILRWSGCVSDQPDEAREDGRPENGDGNFSEDCLVDADGGLCVRVERAGLDPVAGRNTYEGRRYTVAVEVDDGCGNIVTIPGTLRVPHDRRGGSGGQDDPCGSGSGDK